MCEDPPAEIPHINWIDVTKEEYERMMKSYCFPLERVHITKEEAEKWFPEGGVSTPEWDKFKEGVEEYIKELKKNGM